MMYSPVSVRESTPELSTPVPTLGPPLLSPLCSDPEAWELNFTTPGGFHLRFADRSPSCSPRLSGRPSLGSEEEDPRAFSGWRMASDCVDSPCQAPPGQALPCQAPPQGGVEGPEEGLRAPADAVARRTAAESCGGVESESCVARSSLEQGSCHLDLKGAFDSDPEADTWMPGCPASWEGAGLGAGEVAPCGRSASAAAEEDMSLLDALLSDTKQDVGLSLDHPITEDALCEPSPVKFSLDRVASGLGNANAPVEDLTAFLDELEGGYATANPQAHGHSTSAQQPAPHEPFPAGEEEEGTDRTLQDVLDALVGTMSSDSLVDSLADVRCTTPFSATSSSHSHSDSGRGGSLSPVSDGEGQVEASLGSDEPIVWALSASGLDALQGAAGNAEALRGEDAEHLDDSWIDCLLDSEAFDLSGSADTETVQESVEVGPKGTASPLPEAASVRDSVREAVRGVVGLARSGTGLALVGGPGDAPALAPALRAAVARLALDAARAKALKTNKASVRQAVLRASAALESASCLQEEGQQSPEEGAAAVRRALVGRLTTWRQALGIPGAHDTPGSTKGGTPGAPSGSGPLSASQRAACLRRAVALARGKQLPPSVGTLEQGPALVQRSADDKGSQEETATVGDRTVPNGAPTPAPASVPVPVSDTLPVPHASASVPAPGAPSVPPAPATDPIPTPSQGGSLRDRTKSASAHVPGAPLAPPASAPTPPAPAPPQGGSLRDRIKSLLGEASRPQRSPSPPASGPQPATLLQSGPTEGGAPVSRTVSLSRGVLSSGASKAVSLSDGVSLEGVQDRGRSVESAVPYLTRKRSCPEGHAGGAPAGDAAVNKAGRQHLQGSPAASVRRAQLLAAATLSTTGAHRGATLSTTGAHKGATLSTTYARGGAAEGGSVGALVQAGRGLPVLNPGRGAASVLPRSSVGSAGVVGSVSFAHAALAAAMRNPTPANPGSPAQGKASDSKGTSGSPGTSSSLPARLALLARDAQRRQPLL